MPADNSARQDESKSDARRRKKVCCPRKTPTIKHEFGHPLGLFDKYGYVRFWYDGSDYLMGTNNANRYDDQKFVGYDCIVTARQKALAW